MRADADLIQEYTGSRVIGDMNYFTVIPREFPSNLQYRVTQCTVSDDNGNSFDVLTLYSCPRSIVSAQILSGHLSGPFTSEDDKNFGENRFGMAYRAFVFNSDESDQELNLSCDVTVCTVGNCPPVACR